MDQNDLELLQTLPLYHLQAMIKARHITVAPHVFHGHSSSTDQTATVSTPVVLEVARYLFDASSIEEFLDELSALEVVLLQELISCGGRANSRDLALYAQTAGLLDAEKKDETTGPERAPGTGGIAIPVGANSLQPPLYPQAHPHGLFEQAIRHLLLLGFVCWGKQTHFVGRDYTSGMHDGVLIMPQTIIKVAQRRWRSASSTSLPDPSEPDEHLYAFQRRLYLYWSFVQTHGQLALVNSGLLARTALRQISEHMGMAAEGEPLRSENDHPQLFFLRLLLMQLGLLAVRQQYLIARPAEEFFTLTVSERTQRCYQAYMETQFWNELIYLSEINVRPVPDPLTPAHEEVVLARQQVVERILAEETGSWHDVSAFIARTKLHVPYLLFPRRYGPRAERYSQGCNPYGWDFRLRRGWLTHREGWHMVEGGFIRAMLAGPLAWMGLVQERQQEAAFQFSFASGTLMRGQSFQETAVVSNRLVVQPNFELVVLAPVSEGFLVKLDRFAERVSLEHIAQYRLTKASVIRAIQRGANAVLILQTLKSAVEGDIPQNVRYSLEEWERQARRIEIWPDATLIEVADSSLLDSFFADSQFQLLFRRRLTPHLAEVIPAQLDAVQQLLWQQNYLPALTVAPDYASISDAPLPVHEPQWRLRPEDGVLEPIYAVLDFYVLAEAILFCEQDPVNGGLRVTAQSLQRALQDGILLEQIIRFLQHYCQEGIPGAFLIKLKLWGGGYERTPHIYVEQTPLLRLSADVLKDLQSDSELAALLGSEIIDGQRLVHVATDKLPRVLAVLRQRGFLPVTGE
ncbi:hypothetical protein KDW_25660 [Dictyobacter vulcani]|uniref:Helicase XPB/Ssl2 N-terminal domain-containing protein n=1 Tax=Dictyobacter vulcani TaxID=2607529 RepID=A0A5J4KG28_9CHLR|nr:helicase-associated domain-containing protein [Dictyobacter vulcani]GER88404.1 hypothetical protein KDW_25660 [Dictyobacter vulcani]